MTFESKTPKILTNVIGSYEGTLTYGYHRSKNHQHAAKKRSGLLKGTFGGLLYFFPAIAARINKLEKAGIITGYHTTVNLEKLNYHVKAFIQVQLEPSQKKEFYPYVDSIPNVVECNCVTGDYSEVMEVVFETTAALDEFINDIQSRFGKTSTQIVFSTSVEHRGLHLATEDKED